MGLKSKIKTVSPRKVNTWLMLLTVAFILTLFFLYWFVYVKNNEQDQVFKRFKVLAQMGENIYNRERGFRGIAESALDHAEKKLAQRQLNKTDHFDDFLEFLRVELEDAKPVSWGLLNRVNRDKILPLAVFEGKPSHLSEPGKYVIYTEKELFFKAVERGDVFGHMVVVEGQGDIQEGNSSSKVIYDTFPGDLEVPQPDQLIGKDNKIASGRMERVTLSNVDYNVFWQPLYLQGKKLWYIGGVLKSSDFTRENLKLEPGLIIYILIGFLVFLFSIPLLKLLLMSTFEQLEVSDTIWTSLAIILLTGLLVFLGLVLFQEFDDARNIRANLEKLSSEVQERFTGELNRAFDTLEKYDNVFSQDDDLEAGDIVTDVLNKPSFTGDTQRKRVLEKLEALRDYYNLFKLIFWMDSDGMQMVEFSTRNYGGSLSQLGHRSYFKDAGNWSLDGTSEKRFMLESIRSITSGEKLAAISFRRWPQDPSQTKTLADSEVAAMTTQLTSVIDTIMPVGFGFSIIDYDGKVWFHSDTEKNLQENAIVETEQDNEFYSAIMGNQSRHIGLVYQGKRYKCYITPFKHFPLYLVTFHDNQYIQDPQTRVVLYTVYFIFMILLFNGLLMGAASAVNYKKSPLKIRYIPFDWLRPMTSGYAQKVYRHLAVANVSVIILMVVTHGFVPLFEGIFLLLSAHLFVFVYNYYSIIKACGKQPRLDKGVMVVFLLAFLAIIYILSGVTFGWDTHYRLLLFQLGLVILAFVLNIFKPKYSEPVAAEVSQQPHLTENKKKGKYYFGFLTSWLVIICVIPPILIFNDVYNYEQKIDRKYAQLQLAQQIEARNYRIDRFYEERMAPGKGFDTISETKRNRKRAGIYTSVVGDEPKFDQYPIPQLFQERQSAPKVRSKETAYTLWSSRSKLAVEQRNLVFSRASDGSRLWDEEKDTLNLEYLMKSIIDNKDWEEDSTLHISSKFQRFHEQFRVISIIIGLLIFCGIVWIGYLLIRFVAGNVFALHLRNHEFSAPLLPATEPGANPLASEIRGYIRAGAHVMVLCQTQKQKENYKKLQGDDFRMIDDFFLDDCDTDTGTGLTKRLEQAEQLLKQLQQTQQPLILPTLIPLKEIGMRCKQLADHMQADKQAATKRGESVEPDIDQKVADLRKITQIMQEAHQLVVPVYLPLIMVGEAKPRYKSIYSIRHKDLKQLILDEFQPSYYFEAIEEDIYDYLTYLTKDKNSTDMTEIEVREAGEKIILKIQDLAQPYYKKLLNSCTGTEKFVLYDIANNHLINPNNKKTITLLLKKGLLIDRGSIDVMNKSFGNFLLTAISPEDVGHLVGDKTSKGGWSSYKAPLYLLTLGLAVFLAFHENLMSDLNALVAAIVGSLGIFTRFTGLLSGFSSGKKVDS